MSVQAANPGRYAVKVESRHSRTSLAALDPLELELEVVPGQIPTSVHWHPELPHRFVSLAPHAACWWCGRRGCFVVAVVTGMVLEVVSG